MQTNQKIDPISMFKLSEMVEERFKEIMDVFINQIPKDLAKDSGGDGDIKNQMESFTRDLIKKMLAEFPITLASIIPTMFSQPTKFHWELVKHMLEASVKVKREISSRLSSHYNVEDDIKKTKEQLEGLLAREYKTEVLLWRLMDEKKWKETLPVIKAIEMERQNADLPLRLEVANWKSEIAFNLGDSDMFFESLSTILKNSADQILYRPDDMVYAISILLQKELIGFRMALTPIGKGRALTEGFSFVAKQGQQYQDYLIQKIIEAVFIESKISTGEEFRNWIKDTRKGMVDTYKLLNPFVAEIVY